VQVAAFATPEKVNELRNKLKSAGITSYTQRVATESGEKIRVRIGPFTSKEEADKMRAKLAKLGLNGTLVPT
jgi:DedD protein